MRRSGTVTAISLKTKKKSILLQFSFSFGFIVHILNVVFMWMKSRVVSHSYFSFFSQSINYQLCTFIIALYVADESQFHILLLYGIRLMKIKLFLYFIFLLIFC